MPRQQRVNPAAERAVRAATEREPWLPPGFLSWVMGRLAALSLMIGIAWVVYNSASSDQYRVRTLRVQGNVLLSEAEIETAAQVVGSNIFWVDRAQVAGRLRALPLVQGVEIGAVLPDTVEIRIVERQPAAFWISGDQSYLVDGEGVILKAVDAETEQTHACGGQPCDPRLATLPSVAQVDGPSLKPGDRVDANALKTSARLAALLPGVGVQPSSFDWSADAGLEVPTHDGWRARFDQAGDIQAQVATLRTIRDDLARAKVPAELIDVRFADRPYFR